MILKDDEYVVSSLEYEEFLLWKRKKEKETLISEIERHIILLPDIRNFLDYHMSLETIRQVHVDVMKMPPKKTTR